jgi:hypothetical protein
MVGELFRKWTEERPILGRLLHQKFIIRRLLREATEKQVVGPVSGVLVDKDIERIVEEKKREWISKGVRPRLAEMAGDLARGWAERMARWHIEHLRDILPREELERIEKEVIVRYLREGLEKVAEEWVRAFMGE